MSDDEFHTWLMHLTERPPTRRVRFAWWIGDIKSRIISGIAVRALTHLFGDDCPNDPRSDEYDHTCIGCATSYVIASLRRWG